MFSVARRFMSHNLLKPLRTVDLDDADTSFLDTLFAELPSKLHRSTQ